MKGRKVSAHCVVFQPLPASSSLLTGAVSELEADVRPPEHVHGDGQLDLLRPAGAVVVVQHQGVVLVRTWFARAGGHVALQDTGGERGEEGEEMRG